MKKKILKTTVDLFFIAIGAAVFALAVALMLGPSEIVPGGVTGMAMLLNALFPSLPFGLTIIALNVPLFLLSWRLFGNRFLIYSGFGTLVTSLLIDLFAAHLPPLETDPLLAGIFGGLVLGTGLGLVLLKGATTGGSDIIARLLKIPLPGIQIGKLLLVIDGCVVVAAGIVFGSVNHMLYAVVSLFISTRAVDALLYGMNVERLAFIVSENIPDIVQAISEKLERGATLLHGEGSYTGVERKIILCAVKRKQIAALKNLVKEADPKAFLILTEAHEILGEGFGDYGGNL